MDAERFDRIARSLTLATSRRTAVAALLGGITAVIAPDADPEAARRHDKSRQRRRVGASASKRDRGEVQAAKKDGGNGGKKGGDGKKGGGKKGSTVGNNHRDCKRGKRRCGKRCVDTKSSRDHCGRCGRECELDERCQDGQCVAADCAPDCPNEDCRMSQPPFCLPSTCPFRDIGTESHGEPHELCLTCMKCYRTQTRGGEEVCADDLCTGIACEDDQDCLAAFPGLDPGESFCQAAGTGCCGQTCVLACGFTDYGQCAPAALAPEGSNSGCTWEIGLGKLDAACVEHSNCCHIGAGCGDDGYCCRPDQQACAEDDECCVGHCTDGTCCVPPGEACADSSDCCNFNCVDGVCCQDVGGACFNGIPCCGGECHSGQCCFPAGVSCETDDDCCNDGECQNEFCCATVGKDCQDGPCCEGLVCIGIRCVVPGEEGP